MQIIEGFTKPQADPSERVGFWDKIRLNFHSRVNVAWRGQEDVHLKLKGTTNAFSLLSIIYDLPYLQVLAIHILSPGKGQALSCVFETKYPGEFTKLMTPKSS